METKSSCNFVVGRLVASQSSNAWDWLTLWRIEVFTVKQGPANCGHRIQMLQIIDEPFACCNGPETRPGFHFHLSTLSSEVRSTSVQLLVKWKSRVEYSFASVSSKRRKWSWRMWACVHVCMRVQRYSLRAGRRCIERKKNLVNHNTSRVFCWINLQLRSKELRRRLVRKRFRQQIALPTAQTREKKLCEGDRAAGKCDVIRPHAGGMTIYIRWLEMISTARLESKCQAGEQAHGEQCKDCCDRILDTVPGWVLV